MRFEDIPQEIVERARDGKTGAMEELCLMVQPGAYAVLISILRNQEDAADALQESLIRMVRFLPNLHKASAFHGWLMRLLVNQAATHASRAIPVVDLNSEDDPPDEKDLVRTASAPPSPRRAAENLELSAIIQNAILKLSERQRTALVLFELEQMSIREIARTMEISEGAVKFHIHEGRKNVRTHLISAGIADSNFFEGSATK